MLLTSARARSVRLAAGAAVASLALLLSACSGDAASSPTPTASDPGTASATPTPTPSTTPTPVPVSDTIDGISADGAFGEAPALSFQAPFAIDETRTRTLVEGPEGNPPIAEDSIVELQYAGYNARTGEKFDSSWDRGQAAIFSLQQVVPGFQKGLTGASAGDRVLIVMPGTDGYDGSGGNAQIGIEVGDSLVFVADVLAVSVNTATGEPQTPDLPVMVTPDAEGKPEVAFPQDVAAPTELLAEPIIRGTQRAVTAEDYVMVFYRAYNWRTGELIEDKYDTPDAGRLADTIDAWKQGIVGQPIGSRVVLVAPDAYPTGNPNPPIEAGDTIVYVVDILFSSAVA